MGYFEEAFSYLKYNDNFNLVNEKFPHIGKHITFLWGNKEFTGYMNKLFTDTRDGTRQGFPLEVASALLKLQMEHDIVYPEFANKPDKWGF